MTVRIPIQTQVQDEQEYPAVNVSEWVNRSPFCLLILVRDECTWLIRMIGMWHNVQSSGFFSWIVVYSLRASVGRADQVQRAHVHRCCWISFYPHNDRSQLKEGEREYHITLLILELFQTQDSVPYIILDTLDLFDFCFNVWTVYTLI